MGSSGKSRVWVTKMYAESKKHAWRVKGSRGEESRAFCIDLLFLEVVVTIIKVPVLALINSTWDINIDRAPVAYNSLWSQMIFFEKF